METMTQNSGPHTGRGRPSKVVQLIERYELDGIGKELETQWTDEDSKRQSLRDLADYFNKELLRQALQQENIRTLNGEVNNFYRLLTADSVSAADRTQARRRLEQKGINVEQLQSDFVSYQAIRTYLQNYRNLEYEPGESNSAEQLQTTIKQLQNKLVAVTESRLQHANNRNDVSIKDPSVIANVQIVCEDCGDQITIDELRNGTKCNCR